MAAELRRQGVERGPDPNAAPVGRGSDLCCQLLKIPDCVKYFIVQRRTEEMFAAVATTVTLRASGAPPGAVTWTVRPISTEIALAAVAGGAVSVGIVATTFERFIAGERAASHAEKAAYRSREAAHTAPSWPTTMASLRRRTQGQHSR